MPDDGWKSPLRRAIDGGDGNRARQLVDSISGSRQNHDDVLDLLAERASAGSRLAIDVLTELVDDLGLARAVVRRSLVDEAAVEDVAQDTLIAMAESIESFRGDARFKTWLHRIAQNRVVDHLRRQKATQPLVDDVGETQRISSIVATRRDLEQVLAGLPEHHRRAIELRDVQRLSYADIAARLGIPLNTVRSHIRRARAQLAARLADATA